MSLKVNVFHLHLFSFVHPVYGPKFFSFEFYILRNLLVVCGANLVDMTIFYGNLIQFLKLYLSPFQSCLFYAIY